MSSPIPPIPSHWRDQRRGEAPSQQDGDSNRAEVAGLLALGASPSVPAASTHGGSAGAAEAASASRTADTDQAGIFDDCDDDDEGSLFEDPFPNRRKRDATSTSNRQSADDDASTDSTFDFPRVPYGSRRNQNATSTAASSDDQQEESDVELVDPRFADEGVEPGTGDDSMYDQELMQLDCSADSPYHCLFTCGFQEDPVFYNGRHYSRKGLIYWRNQETIERKAISWRGVLYAVLGLVVGLLIGFLAHPSESPVVHVTTTHRRDPTTLGTPTLTDPRPNAPWPRIAWLMSFPNSGTSYTLNLVKHSSRQFVASNYGQEGVDVELGVSIPVFSDSPQGPFWLASNRNYTYPDRGYIMTKTHCGIRCFDCNLASAYMETQHMFQTDCLSGKRMSKDSNGNTVASVTAYDASLVHKAIHLIRNPFNNAVARFHLYLHEGAESYTNDREGFRSFCMYENDKWENDERESPLLEQTILDMVGHVPCHADFIRFIRWHNLAFTTTKNLQVPTLILHYENYETRFNQTMMEVLDFLEKDLAGPPNEFIAGKDYLDFFSDQEIRDIHATFKELAYFETWKNIKHYFENL